MYKALLAQPISIRSLQIFYVVLPQKSSFKSGIGHRLAKHTLIVRWEDKTGKVVYGECSCRPDPYFSSEFLEASLKLFLSFIFPSLKPELTYGELIDILEKIRGWNFTKTGLEECAYKLAISNSGVKEEYLFGESPLDRVPTGISLGIYASKEEYYKAVDSALKEGYSRLKFKISPQANTEYFDYIKPLLKESGIYLGFDANGSLGETDIDLLSYFVDSFDCAIEQPFSPFDMRALDKAKDQIPNLKICFDEEVENIGDLMKVHRLGLIDELNLKIGRVGGVYKSIEIVHYCQKEGIPIWMGGMFETGVGRLRNLSFARFLKDSKAHDLSPSSRYFPEDIVSPEIYMEQGQLPTSQIKEIGVLEDRIRKYSRKEVLTLKF